MAETPSFDLGIITDLPDTGGNGWFSGLSGRWSGGDLPFGISREGEVELPSGSERDLASHYYMSKQLADRFGKIPAALGGVAQEFLNRGAVESGGGGWSWDDLAANYAGYMGATPEQTARAGLFEHTEPPESWEGRGQGTISGNWDKIRALHAGSFPLVRKLKGLFTDGQTSSGALTPQELFRQRNDAEELRIREGGVPNIPDVPIWNPQASIPPDFRVNERSMASLSPTITFNPPPIADNLEALRGLIKSDPGVAEKYIGPLGEPAARTRLMENLESLTPVETFVDIPRTPWAPQAPVIPDISDILKTYVLPTSAQEPYVETFEEITPPKKVVKKKVKKAASAARKKEAKREAATKKKAAEQRAKLDSASKKALQDHMAWMATQTKRVAKEEKKRAKRYAGGRGGALMYT